MGKAKSKTSQVLGVRLKNEEMAAVLKTATSMALRASEWARKVIVERLTTTTLTAAPANLGTTWCAPKHPRTWSSEWSAMERMEPREAADRFVELAAGRELPGGFRSWAKDAKIAWLDKHWPLEG